MEIVAGLISTAAVLYFPYRIVIENNITVQIGSSRQYSSIHLLSFTTVLPERFESPLSVYRTSIVQQITLELLAAITRYEKKTSESYVSASTENRQQHYLQCVR